MNNDFLRKFPENIARPFLARELINVPKLPYSLEDFGRMIQGAVNPDEKEKEYIGYFVEWEGKFYIYERISDGLLVVIMNTSGLSDLYHGLLLYLPAQNFDVIKILERGQSIKARGIIIEFSVNSVILNYVELQILQGQ